MLTGVADGGAKLAGYLEGLRYFDPQALGNRIQLHSIQQLVSRDGLEATLGEIRRCVTREGVDLLIIDSLSSIHSLAGDSRAVHRFLHKLGTALYMLGCTGILIQDHCWGEAAAAERTIGDTVLELEAPLDGWRESRWLRVIKMRGADPLGGLHPFDITAAGVTVYPKR